MNLDIIEPGAGTEEQNEFLKSVPPINLFKALANQPAVAQKVAELGGAILYQTELDAKVRELAILRAAHLAGCDYEIVHHERIGRDVGLRDKALRAVGKGGDLSVLTDAEQLACRFSEEILASGFVDAGLLKRAGEVFGIVQTLELVSTVAYYLMVATVLTTFAIPVEGEGFSKGVQINSPPDGFS